MHLQRKLALSAVVAAVALLGAVVVRTASGMAAHTSSTTLTVWTMEDSAKFTQLLQGFTKQTGIKVQVDAIPWGNVDDKLTTAVASGHGPDVTQIGLSELSTFIAAKALKNLAPYVRAHPALADKNFPKGISSKKINGPTICRRGAGSARRTPKPPRSRARGMISVSMDSAATASGEMGLKLMRAPSPPDFASRGR